MSFKVLGTDPKPRRRPYKSAHIFETVNFNFSKNIHVCTLYMYMQSIPCIYVYIFEPQSGYNLLIKLEHPI